MPTTEPDQTRLVLAASPASASAARRACEAALASWGLDDLTGDADLVVTELVTNAVLHAGTDIEVAIRRLPGGAHIEVRDGSPTGLLAPVLPAPPAPTLLGGEDDLDVIEHLLSVEATTGRGLRLVGRVAAAWGVRRSRGGKTVWAVVGDAAGFEPGGEEEAEVAAEEPRGTHPVRLVAVPVRLALESSLYLDAVVREMQMMAEGTDLSEKLPQEVVTMASTLVDDYLWLHDAARQAVGRAVETGNRLFDLSILMPDDAPQALRRMMQVLDRIATLSEEGSLLALAPSPETRAFRMWYSHEVDRQFSGLPPRACPFSVVPQLDEPVEVSLSPSARRAVEAIASKLEKASGREDVHRILLGEIVGVLGAAQASLSMRVEGTDTVEIASSIGMPEPVASHWRFFPVGADLPASEVIRTGAPVVLRTRDELFLRYPAFEGTPVVDDFSFVCVPLIGQGSPTGCLTASFHYSREFGAHALQLFAELCNQAAAADARFLAREAESRSNRMKRLVDEVADAAAGYDAVDDRLSCAVVAMGEGFDGICAAFVKGVDGRPRLVHAVHPEPARAEAFKYMQHRWPPADPAGAVVRCLSSGETVVFQVVPDDLLSRIALDEDHLRTLTDMAVGSVVVAPVRRRGLVVGALGCATDSGRYLLDSEVQMVRQAAERLSW